jgi:hypothetical protein
VVYSGSLSADTLAQAIACIIVRIRCPDVVYHKWLEACAGTRQLTAIETQELETYIKPSIGLRGSSASDDQVQAVVAEHVWYELTRSADGEHGLPIKITAPSLRVTEPGGDGLAIYKTGESTYIFRLWEIKKHTGNNSATSKITEASKQLTASGAEYLAKWSKVEQEVDHQYANLSKFYAKLVSMWLEADSKASAGISVSKDDSSQITGSPIAIMKRHMPTFTADNQLEGLIISIPDFADLAHKVREELWKGI